MSEFVKFKVSDELKALQEDTLRKIAKTGKIKIGINEVTKMIERGQAKLVVIAEDVSPQEIVMHLPIIAKEKNIPFTYVKTREELGNIVGISTKASSIAVLDEGIAKKELSSLISKINEMITGKVEPKQEAKKEEVIKEKPKQEAKKEEVVKEKPKQEVKKEEVIKENPKQEVKKEEVVKEKKPKKSEEK